MNVLLPALFGDALPGLFGDSFVATFALLGGAAGFVSLAITLRRGRVAVTVPTPPVVVAAAPASALATDAKAPLTPPPPSAAESIPAEVMALISAAVALTLGEDARIAAVAPTPPVELLQQWSIEGRRQIYSSHQIR